MKRAVLVNGLPASGKTMVARTIVEATGWPLLTLDSIKEPFFDELGMGDRAWNRSLGRAAYAAMWTIIADAARDATFVLDAWFGFQPIDVLLAHIARAGVEGVVEIWCHAPGNVLADRYLARVAERHPGHPGAAYAPELATRAGEVSALGRFPIYDHDSTQPVRAAALMAWVYANLD